MRTVLGDVASEELGPTYAHEHLLTRPMGDQVRDDPDLVLGDEQRAAAELRSLLQGGPGAGRGDHRGTRPRHRRAAPPRAANGGPPGGGHRACLRVLLAGSARLEDTPERELVSRLVRDLTQGMDGTGVRAGVIKVGSSQDRVTELEHRVIRAAAAAQRETGAPITTHTTAGTAAIQQVRALEAAPATLSSCGTFCPGFGPRG